MPGPPKENKNLLLQYAGFAIQVIAGIIIGVYAGREADKWINTAKPLWIWLLPLLIIIGFIVKAVKDTSKK